LQPQDFSSLEFHYRNAGNQLISITVAKVSLEVTSILMVSLVHNVFSGAVHFIAAINDSGVREYDMERYQLYKHFRFEYPVNVSFVICMAIYFFVFRTLSRALLLLFLTILHIFCVFVK
jgi:hypothetical protein